MDDLVDREMQFDDKGYVIRCVDQFTGRVIYRGSHRKHTYEKDALMPSETFTLSGAKKALANLQRIYPEGGFYSIERLSCYYIDFGEQRTITDPKQKIYDKISHAMNRLDELWDGNEFDNGNKMRINEIRADLRSIKTIMLKQEDRDY